jgi:tRNA(Ile)-lysidine synthase
VTNAAPLYARNRLRLEVLPLLEALNPRVAETLAATAEQAAAEGELLAALTEEARARVSLARAPGELARVDLAALAAERPAVRALVLHDLARAALGGQALVERAHVEALLRLAERPDEAGRTHLGRGIEAVREAGTLRLRPSAAPHVCAPVEVCGEDLVAAGSEGLPVVFCGERWRLRLLPGAVFDRRAALLGQAFVALAATPRRVRLGHPCRGERFSPLGLGGETTVARYLAAARVPAGLRPRVVVLGVDGAAAWVGGRAAPPGRVAQDYRVAHSRALTLHVIQEGT